MRRLLLIALAVLPVLVILTLPAGLVIPRFDPPAALGQYGGTVWRGQARWRQAGQVPMTLSWRWAWPWRWDWEAADGRSRIQGEWRPGRGIDLSDVEGRLAIERLDLAAWLPLSPPQGTIRLDLDTVRIPPGGVPRLQGLAVWEDARLAGVVQEDLGQIQLRFDPLPAGADERQVARVQSVVTAALLVQGSIEFGAETYQVDLWLQASPDRPDLAAQLGQLGERQPDGRVRVRLQGRLGLDPVDSN
jgi:hypothetical protein